MALSKKSVDRLTALIDYMKTIPPDHFRMSGWLSHQKSVYDLVGKHGIKDGAPIKETVLIECGMAACAFGWACTMPRFKRAGLQLQIYHEAGVSPDRRRAFPFYKGEAGFNAAGSFFGITYEQAEMLFDPVGIVADETPKEWAVRAKKLLKAWARREG